MTSINLKLNAERVFGRFLPTVYMKRAVIETNEGAADPADQDDLRITTELSVSLTKPENMTRNEVRAFVENNFDDLYLYLWISPYEKLNTDLENSNLKLHDLFRMVAADSEVSPETLSAESVITSRPAKVPTEPGRPCGISPRVCI